MADLKNIFDVAARGMSAQMVRLNTVASNLANSRSVASSEQEAYRAIKPVFSTLYADDLQKSGVASPYPPVFCNTGPSHRLLHWKYIDSTIPQLYYTRHSHRMIKYW